MVVWKHLRMCFAEPVYALFEHTKGECVNTVDDGIVVRVYKVSSEKASIHSTHALFLCFTHTNTHTYKPTDFQSSYHNFYIRFEIQSSSYHLLDRHEF